MVLGLVWLWRRKTLDRDSASSLGLAERDKKHDVVAEQVTDWSFRNCTADLTCIEA